MSRRLPPAEDRRDEEPPTATPLLAVFPGADVPPPEGHELLKVPPAQMREGDRLLLGDRIRIVHRRREAGGGRVVIVLFAGDSGADTDQWTPETGDLPLPIWRPSRDAPRTEQAITTGRADGGRHLTIAASLATRPDLGPLLAQGIGSIPTLPEEQDRGPHWRESAHWPAFERTRPAPSQPSAAQAEPGGIAQLLAGIERGTRSGHLAETLERF